MCYNEKIMALSFEGPSLQVPVREFTQPGVASVALVGMVHWAEPDFYRSVADYVAFKESEGSEIHYELVNQPDFDDVDKSTLAKFVAFSIAGIGNLAAKGMFKDIGLVSQLEVFKPQAHWENHDTTLFGLVDELDALALAYPFVGGIISTPGVVFNRVSGNPKVRESMINVLNTAIRQSEGLEKKNSIIDFLDGNTEHAIIDTRNKIALDAVAEHLRDEPQQDLTLIWGAAHLAGIGRGLIELGFEMTKEFSLTAIKAPIQS